MIKENKISQAGGLDSAPLQCQTSPSHRILVVDDESTIRELSTTVLRRSGYHVDAVEDGAAAWQALNSGSYDLMITDNNMPKVSGIELLKKLHGAHMPLLVIMATGTLPTQEFARCPWLQPIATLPKPFTADKLLETVKVVLRTTDAAHGHIAPPNLQGQPSAVGLQQW